LESDRAVVLADQRLHDVAEEELGCAAGGESREVGVEEARFLVAGSDRVGGVSGFESDENGPTGSALRGDLVEHAVEWHSSGA